MIKDNRILERVTQDIKDSEDNIRKLKQENGKHEAIEAEEAGIARSKDLLKRTEDALEEFVRQRKEVG